MIDITKDDELLAEFYARLCNGEEREFNKIIIDYMSSDEARKRKIRALENDIIDLVDETKLA